MAVGDIFETTTLWDVDGTPVVNVTHFRQNAWDGVMSRADLCVNLLDLMRDSMVSFYLPTLADIIDLDRLDAFVLQEDTVSGTLSPLSGGVLAGELIPIRSSPVVRKNTILRGRSFRGRMYLPPILETQQSGGLINVAQQTNINTWLADFRLLNDGLGNTFRMTVYSPTLSDPSMSIWQDEPVTSSIVQGVLGSIRKRQDVN